jgi:hypothetical protein
LRLLEPWYCIRRLAFIDNRSLARVFEAYVFDMSSCLKIFWDRLPFVVSLRKIYLCY